MKSISKILVAITILLSLTACDAQIKNAKTESVKIFGNCEMCESTIEKAGKLKKVALVDWNKDSKMATITYDATKTTTDEILKRIALSGYDNEKFLAPNDAYSKLAECCQYERKAKTTTKVVSSEAETPTMEMKEDHSNHNSNTKQEEPQLKTVFEHYFSVKDALVKSDGTATSAKSKELLTALNSVKMELLSAEEHTIWMKVMNDVKSHVQKMADSKNISKQREHFMNLSQNIYNLIKVSETETPTYYQHCPMANDGKGANWLSKENAVKNPYYGNQMLTCGKTVETIK